MKTTTKIIIGIGTAIAGYTIYKGMQLKEAMTSLQYKLGAISKLQLDIANLGVKGVMSLNITNPTNIDIGVNSAKTITLKEVRLFKKSTGQSLGTAHVNITSISIPKQSTITLRDIPIEVKVIGGVYGTDNTDLQTQIVLDLLGVEYVYNYNGVMGLNGGCNCQQKVPNIY